MNVLEQLTLAWQAFRHTVPRIVSPKLWLWALPLVAVQLVVVLLLWNATHPLVSWFMAPLLVATAGEATLHYPRIFELMPGIFDRADSIIGAIVGSIAFGAATPAFAAAFRGEPVNARAALTRAFAQAPRLVLVLLPFNLVLFAIDWGTGHVLLPMLAGRTIVRALPLLATVASLAAQSASFYAVALVALEHRGAGDALRQLPSTWRPGFLAAFVVSAVTLILLEAARLPGVTPGLLVERGTPELAGWLTVWHVVMELLNGFVLTGAATLLYLSAVAPRLQET